MFLFGATGGGGLGVGDRVGLCLECSWSGAACGSPHRGVLFLAGVVVF